MLGVLKLLELAHSRLLSRQSHHRKRYLVMPDCVTHVSKVPGIESNSRRS